MPVRGQIRGFVIGNDFPIFRTIRGIPLGFPVEKAWFTVKASVTASDESSAFQKIITENYDPLQGQITNPGTKGTCTIRFDVSADESRKLSPGREYVYDITIRTSDGKTYTPEIGKLKGEAPVTKNPV